MTNSCDLIIKNITDKLSDDADKKLIDDLANKVKSGNIKQAFDVLNKIKEAKKEDIINNIVSNEIKRKTIQNIEDISKLYQGGKPELREKSIKEAFVSLFIGDKKFVNSLGITNQVDSVTQTRLISLKRDLEAIDPATYQLFIHENLFSNTQDAKARSISMETLSDNITRELHELNKADGKFGITGSEIAQQYAKVYKKHLDIAREDFRLQGGNVVDLEGWAGKQTHDTDKLLKAGYDKWKEDVLALGLDSSMEPSALREMFKTITTEPINNNFSRKTDGFLVNKYTKPRYLKFANVDAELAYKKMYGYNQNINYQLTKTISNITKESVIMENLSTNPFELLADIKKHYKTNENIDLGYKITKDDNGICHIAKTQKLGIVTPATVLQDLFENQWQDLTFGKVNLSKIFRYTRVYESVAKLGPSLLSSVIDTPSSFVLEKLRGGSNKSAINVLSKTLSLTMKSIWHAPSEILRLNSNENSLLKTTLINTAKAYQIGLSALDRSIIQTLSPDETSKQIKDFGQKISEIYFKLSGEEIRNLYLETMHGVNLSSGLVADSKYSFDMLTPKRQTMLSKYGINSKEWDIIRTNMIGKIEDTDAIIPQHISNVPDEALKNIAEKDPVLKEITDKTINKARTKLDRKISTLWQREISNAMLYPDKRTQIGLRLGTESGTFSRELTRFSTQFLSFTTQMTSSVLQGIWNHPNISKYGKLGTFIVLGSTLIVTAYMSETMKDLVGNKTPKELNSETALLLLRKSGITGIWGEVVFNMLGGLASEASDNKVIFEKNVYENIFNSTFGVVPSEAVEGVIKTAELIRDPRNNIDSFSQFIKKNIPLSNIYYIKPFIEYAMIETVLSNQGKRKYEKNLEKYYGQERIVE